MKTNVTEFISRNFKTIVTIVSFLVAFYVQSVTNTNSIAELKDRSSTIEERQREQETQINSLKIDRAAYQATVEQVALIREDIKEMRSDIKELLKKK